MARNDTRQYQLLVRNRRLWSKTTIKKTLDHKLRDLDDHLYFLTESLAKLTAGDEAYRKPLAAELRVLICKANGTEGLLWRIIDELGVSDAVHVHLAGNLNREHPLARDIEFAFVPIRRVGRGHSGLPSEYYSLKEIIKEGEALVVSGTGYTHESLIRAVAEQMGSAHEDEGVEPHLIELSGTMVCNQSALNSVLMSDADLVLEVGERALLDAVQKVNFVRKTRPQIRIPFGRTNFALSTQSNDFECDLPASTSEGTMIFILDSPHSDWRTNSSVYSFGRFSQGSMSVSATKYSDRTLEVCLEGVEEPISTRQLIPNADQSGLVVAVTWSTREASFYFSGICVDIKQY